jgi:hypothetical protein
MVFDTGHRPLVAVLVLNQICWSAVDVLLAGVLSSLEKAGDPTGVVLTELSSAIVVSPEVMFVVLPVLTIGAPFGAAGGVVGGVVVVVGGEPQDTELVLVVHPFCKLVKLSSPLLTQPLKAKVIIIKANPEMLRITLSRNHTDAQIAAIPIILR